MENKITLKEAIGIISDFGIDSDNFIQSNFKQFLNHSGDADDNSIDLHYYHTQCLKMVVNEGIKAINDHEATKLALSKLQLQHLEATEQIEQLEAENEKLKNDIMLIIAPKEVGGGIDAYKEGLLAEARKGIEKAISESIFYTLGIYDIWNLLDSQQKETLTEAINIGLNVAIEPQQPKSCEGCEQEPLQSKLTCYTCRYEEIEQHRKPCNTCNDFSNYQPKEK